MGRPLNMPPEEWARQIVAEQQEYIKYLEDNQKPGGGPQQEKQQPVQQPVNVVHPSLYERDADREYQDGNDV